METEGSEISRDGWWKIGTDYKKETVWGYGSVPYLHRGGRYITVYISPNASNHTQDRTSFNGNVVVCKFTSIR